MSDGGGRSNDRSSRRRSVKVQEYDEMRYDAILTDAFSKDYLVDPVHHRHKDHRLESRVA